MTQFDGHQLHRGPDRGAGPQVLGVTIAGDDLSRRYRLEPEAVADLHLDRRVDVGVRADRSAELAHGDRLPGGTEPTTITFDLQCPERDLAAERHRLGVDAVRAPDHHSVAMRVGEVDDCLQQRRRRIDQKVGSIAQRPAPSGVDDVARCQAVVNPRARRRTDVRLNDVDESGNIVICDCLAITDRPNERGVGDRCLRPARRSIGGRHDAESRLCLGGQQFDLDIPTEAGGVREDRRHLRQRVPIDHCHSSTASRAGPVPT